MNASRRTALLAGLAALLAPACDGGGEERALSRLERLVFVPAGSCVLMSETSSPVDCSTQTDLLVERFEVTREEYRAWLDGGQAPPEARECLRFWNEASTGSEPATGMTLAEGAAFAASQGMRLPTAREWIRLTVGTRRQFFPWGPSARESVANTLDLKLERLAPVGTFEAGSTASGIYDLLGNAAEWTSDAIGPAVVDVAAGRTWEFSWRVFEPLRLYRFLEQVAVWASNASRPLVGVLEDDRTWALGGSYLTRRREVYRYDAESEGQVAFNARQLDPRHRGRDLGLRLVVDAEEWLRSEARSWPPGRELGARLELTGRAWGSGAVPLLERLAAEEGAPEGLAALLRGAQRP